MSATMEEISRVLDKELTIGRKVTYKKYAILKSGGMEPTKSRTGKIEAVYPYIVSVRFGGYVECFSKALFFSRGKERVRF